MADFVTEGGRAFSAGLLSNTETQLTTYYGNVGTGAGVTTPQDTTLFTEVGTERIAITPTRVTTDVPNDTAEYVFTYVPQAAINITNAGYFTAVTGGILIQKTDHAAIPLLSSDDTIKYTFQNKQA